MIKCSVSEIQKVAYQWRPKKTWLTAVYEVTQNQLQLFCFMVKTNETCCIVFQPQVPQPIEVSGSHDILKYDLTHLNRADMSIYGKDVLDIAGTAVLLGQNKNHGQKYTLSINVQAVDCALFLGT